MAISLYDASIPAYVRMLKNLSALLDKGEAYAKEKGVDLSTLVTARLAPDMADLARQIQYASDAAKGGAARLAGHEPPSFPDGDTTFAQMKDRIAKTIAFVETVDRGQVDGQEDRVIEIKLPGRTLTFNGADFLLGFSLPNFLFHVTTAYDLLRAQGVPLAKMDYLAGANMKVTPDQAPA